MPDPMQTVIVELFLRGLRVGTLAVTAVILCCWHLPVALSFGGSYRWDGVQFVALGVLIAVTAVAAVIVVVDRPWGRWRWPLVAVTFGATVTATAAVRPADLVLAPHWSWKVFGFYAALLLMDLPPRWFLGALGAQQAVTTAQVLAAGRTDAATLVELGVTGILMSAWQCAIALSAAQLRRSADDARRVAAEEAELRTAERVAEQLHGDRQDRYAELAVTTAPLLAGLAAGDLDPGERQVQRACAVEAARMRRLFAEGDDVAEPLIHELRACIDVAERRGVAVHLSVRGSLPPIPVPTRRALTGAAIDVLSGARSVARVTVVAADGQVILSLVADGDVTDNGAAGDVAGGAPLRDLHVTRVGGDDRVWVEAAWNPMT
jgi:hypothetical protein